MAPSLLYTEEMKHHRCILLVLAALLLVLGSPRADARPRAGIRQQQARQVTRPTPRARRGLLGWCKRILSPATRRIRPPVFRDSRGIPEVRRGQIPNGTAPIPASVIPSGGLFDFSVSQGSLNINVVARGPQTRGHMSDLLARRVRQAGGPAIKRVNISDVVNTPTLEAMRAGTAFLDAPQLGRMVQRTMDALDLRPIKVEVSGAQGTVPKMSVFIKVAPKR